MSAFFQCANIARSRRLSGTPSTPSSIGPCKSAADRVYLGATIATAAFAGKNTSTVQRIVEAQGSPFGFDLLCHAILILKSAIIDFKT